MDVMLIVTLRAVSEMPQAAEMQVCSHRAGSEYMIRFHWFPVSCCCKTTREDQFNTAEFNS